MDVPAPPLQDKASWAGGEECLAPLVAAMPGASPDARVRIAVVQDRGALSFGGAFLNVLKVRKWTSRGGKRLLTAERVKVPLR